MAKSGPKNTITRTVNLGSVFESAVALLTSTLNLDQGDLVIYDNTNYCLKLPTVEGDGQYFLGVQAETILNGKLLKPYVTPVDASQAITDIPGPQFGVIAKCHLKTGDTLNPGAPVYLFPTTWTNRGIQASGTKIIGVYQGSAVTGGPSTAPTEVEIYIGHRYPGDTLSF